MSRSQEDQRYDQFSAEPNTIDMPTNVGLEAPKKIESFDSGTFLQSETSSATFKKLSVNDLVVNNACYSNTSYELSKSSLRLDDDSELAPNLISTADLGINRDIYADTLTQFRNPSSSKHAQGYDQLQERVINLVEENNTNMETLRQTEDKLEFSEDQLVSKNSEISLLKQALEISRDKIQELEESVVRVSLEKNMLEEESAETNRRLQQATNALYTHADQANNLVESYRLQTLSENQSLVEEKSRLLAENSIMKKQIIESTEVLQRIEEEKQQNEGKTVKALINAQEQISELIQELDQSREKIKTLEGKTSDLDELNKKCEHDYKFQLEKIQQNTEKEKEDLRIELERATDELKKAENKMKDYQSSIDSLMNQHVLTNEGGSSEDSGHRTPVQQLTQIDVYMAKKDAYITRLEAEKTELSDAAHSNEILKVEIATLKRNTKTDNLKLAELESLCNTLQKANKDLVTKTCEFSERTNQLQSECDSLETRLNERTSQLITQKDELKVISEMENKLLEKDNEINRLKSETQELKNSSNDLILKITSLENDLSTKDVQFETQKQQIYTLTAENRTTLQQMKDNFDEQTQAITEQHNKMRAEAVRYRDENQELRRKIEQLTKELTETLNEVELLGQELTDTRLAENNKSKCHDLALRNLQDMASNDNQRVKNLEMELNSCKAKLSVHIGQIETMQDDYKDSLVSKNEQISNLETKMRMYTSTLDEEMENKKQLEQSLKDRMEIVKKLNDRVVSLENEKENLETELTLLNEKNENYVKSSRDLKQKLIEQCSSMENELNEKDCRLEELQQKLRCSEDELSLVKEHLENYQKEKNDRVIEKEENLLRIEQLECEVNEVKKQLYEKIDEVERFRNDLAEMKHERTQAENQCKELQTKMFQFQSNYQELDRRYQVLVDQIQSTGGALSERTDEITNLEAQNRILHEEVQSKEKGLYQTEAKLSEQQYEMALRQDQVQQLTAQISQFQIEKESVIESLRKRVDELKEELSKRTEQKAKLDEELNEIRLELSEARSALQEKTRIVSELTRDGQVKEKKITQLEQMVKEKHENEDHMARELAVCVDRENNSKSRVEQCRQELEGLYSHLNKVRDEAHEMANCIQKKEKHAKKLEALVKTLKKEKLGLKNELSDQRTSTTAKIQRLTLFHEQEFEKLKSHNEFLLQRSSNTITDSETMKRHKADISQLKNQLAEKDEVISSALNKIKLQEEAMSSMQMELEDNEADRILGFSCRANLYDELYKDDQGEDTASSMSESMMDLPLHKHKQQACEQNQSNSRLSSDLENDASLEVSDLTPMPSMGSLCENDLDNSLSRRIFGPIGEEEKILDNSTPLENSMSLKEMQREFIASSFRM